MWSPKVTYSTRCIAGFGLIATKPLTKGEVLFVTPKSACLVSRRDRGDTQRRAATKLIKEARKKARSKWRPFLRTLKPAPCPWTWSAADRSLLQGTELEAEADVAEAAAIESGAGPVVDIEEELSALQAQQLPDVSQGGEHVYPSPNGQALRRSPTLEAHASLVDIPGARMKHTRSKSVDVDQLLAWSEMG